MVINHNLGALNANRMMNVNSSNASKSMEKLSSGLRINRAGDDAAGLAISEKMRGQIRGLDQASSNAQDGISMIQTAEGALNEVHAILQRQRELAVQAANDTNVTTDRSAIDSEFQQLTSEIARIKDTSEFNTKKLNNGQSVTVALQVGANEGQTISVDFLTEGVDLTTVTGTILSSVSVTTQALASSAITAVETALETVSAGRAYLGAMQNRLEHTINNLGNASENLTAAESRIRDVDMAKEMSTYSKNNILTQAAQAMLAQANQQPQNVLSLLR